MADWGFLGALFEAMQTHSPLLGRLWLQIMLVFRMLILGTVGSDLFEDEQEQFECNTAQPGCKQVCYDEAFPISQYRFWVFHIVLISTPALLFLMYAMHLNSKSKASSQDSNASYGQLTMDPTASAGQLKPPSSKAGPGEAGGVNPREDRRVVHLYMLNVGFRFLAEVAFLVGQWALYGFRVPARYPCSRFPCPYTVDCFSSRPMEKTVFLCFYFAVGVLSALFSLAELLHVFVKWRRWRRRWRRGMNSGGSVVVGSPFGEEEHSYRPAPGEPDGGRRGEEAGPVRDWPASQRGRPGGGSGSGRRQMYVGRGRGSTGGSSSSSRAKVRVTLGRTASNSSLSRLHSSSSAGHKAPRTSSQHIHMV